MSIAHFFVDLLHERQNAILVDKKTKLARLINRRNAMQLAHFV